MKINVKEIRDEVIALLGTRGGAYHTACLRMADAADREPNAGRDYNYELLHNYITWKIVESLNPVQVDVKGLVADSERKLGHRINPTPSISPDFEKPVLGDLDRDIIATLKEVRGRGRN